MVNDLRSGEEPMRFARVFCAALAMGVFPGAASAACDGGGWFWVCSEAADESPEESTVQSSNLVSGERADAEQVRLRRVREVWHHWKRRDIWHQRVVRWERLYRRSAR